MKRLSKRESELMGMFWKYGAMTVLELRARMPHPQPHVSTVSTQVRLLESNGFLDHIKEGGTFRYHAIISSEEYSNASIGRLVSHCFGNSYVDAVSALVKDEKISVQELKDLIGRIESQQSK
ncbi:MAG TPA: BlaI/MecI/CopY family transcriptional regulator [Bacteroidaceae bacterium]|nr:BlaI/MecI/CopY family transcriptional regulator [Bacteroidaceae bacterium]